MKNFIRSIPGKVTMFISFTLALAVLLICAAGAFFMIDSDIYENDERSFRREYRRSIVQANITFCLSESLRGAGGLTLGELPDFYEFRAGNADGSIAAETDGFAALSANPPMEYDLYTFRIFFPGDEIASADSEGTAYSVTALVDSTRFHDPGEKIFADFVHTAYQMRYTVYPVGLAALLLCVILFVAMMCAAGHRPGTEEIFPGTFAAIPFDVILIGAAAISVCFFVLSFYGMGDPFSLILLGISAVVTLEMFLGLCMNFAARVKLGTLGKTLLITRIFRALGRLFRALGRLITALPLVWKTVFLLGGLTAAEFLIIVLSNGETDNLLLWWLFEKLVVAPLVLWAAVSMKRLQRLGRRLADGDLTVPAVEGAMLPDFRRHAENLVSIRAGLERSVERQMRSERMKTELITNVSHDIKTPLTSIINYSDLISREECENERIREYSEVLLRQSTKLKRLIEDLVEASKAATGNLDCKLSLCEASVFLSQAGGEFDDRLAAAGLEPVTTLPGKEVFIMADSRRMWRIFDNLMNNICKYSQPGTRVYLGLQEIGNRAVFNFRNTSRDALNISPEELMERFVRGDASRSGDGNGLGLSIAKSLTELQGGTMQISIDGDLFKVLLSFPTHT